VKLRDAAISFWQMMGSTMDLSRPLSLWYLISEPLLVFLTATTDIYLPHIGHASHVCEGEKASLRDTPQVNHLRGTIQLLTEHSSHPGSNTALPSRWDLLQRAASLNVAESSRSCPVADNQVSLLVLVSAFINTPANVKHAFTIINHINHKYADRLMNRTPQRAAQTYNRARFIAELVYDSGKNQGYSKVFDTRLMNVTNQIPALFVTSLLGKINT
jgi:hypothetical protein